MVCKVCSKRKSVFFNLLENHRRTTDLCIQINDAKKILSVVIPFVKCKCSNNPHFKKTVLSKLKEFQAIKGMITYVKQCLNELKIKTHCSGQTTFNTRCKLYTKSGENKIWYCNIHKEQSVFLYSLQGVLSRYMIPNIEQICLEYYSVEKPNTNNIDLVPFYATLGDWITVELLLNINNNKYESSMFMHTPSTLIYILIKNGYTLMTKYYLKKLKIKPT